MKSKTNFLNRSYSISFPVTTWIFIKAVLTAYLKKEHSPSFINSYISHFYEIEEILSFNPPFKVDADSFITIRFK